MTGLGGIRLPQRSSPVVEWAGLALVVVFFCAPLFAGLDRWDLRSDEAIYSYSVDRILETGEWLTPRSIEVDGPFLEKPPLKFWMVAALMRVGLVPQNEFGMRFLDALFGAMAFVYVYLFGARLGGTLCGLAASLTLFTSTRSCSSTVCAATTWRRRSSSAIAAACFTLRAGWTATAARRGTPRRRAPISRSAF